MLERDISLARSKETVDVIVEFNRRFGSDDLNFVIHELTMEARLEDALHGM